MGIVFHARVRRARTTNGRSTRGLSTSIHDSSLLSRTSTRAAPARGRRDAMPWASEPLPHLRDGYDPCTFAPWDSAHAVVRASAWVDVFRRSTTSFEVRASGDARAFADDGEREERARGFGRAFEDVLRAVELGDDAEAEKACREASGTEWPAAWRGANCLELCRARDGLLRSHGFADVFEQVKREENETAMRAVLGVFARCDAVEDDDARLLELVRGAFAGNIFDLGAAASTELFENGGVNFARTVETLRPRPWCVDDFDALRARFREVRHKKAIVFVDNAGADVCLGMIPFVRELLRRGTEVVLAANETPSINDVTARELREHVFPLLIKQDDETLCEAIARGRLRVVSSGSDMPVIDLRYLSPEICAEAKDADLLVLEGMGRGIETNLFAQFTIDCLKLAMIKHEEVATLLKGNLYDCVCKFDVGSGAT